MTDVSKTVIVVLIIATIVVSVLGTWIVFNAVDKAIASKFAISKGHGKVTVDIVRPTEPSTGHVTVNIQKPA